jgi:hypothetical protein
MARHNYPSNRVSLVFAKGLSAETVFLDGRYSHDTARAVLLDYAARLIAAEPRREKLTGYYPLGVNYQGDPLPV